MTNSQAMTGVEIGRRQHGFTLMELMIVVVIIGILSGVAFPAYKAYVDRAKRSEGAMPQSCCCTTSRVDFTSCAKRATRTAAVSDSTRLKSAVVRV